MATNCLTNLPGLGGVCEKGNQFQVAAGLFFTPYEYEFSTASDFISQTQWETDVAADNIFPAQDIKEVENVTPDNGAYSTPTGESITTFESRRAFLYKFHLPVFKHKDLQAYGGKQLRVFIVDRFGNLIGTSPDGTAIKGFAINYSYVPKRGASAADTVALSMIRIEYYSNAEHDNKIKFVETDGWPFDLLPVSTVTAPDATVTTNAFTITLESEDSSKVNSSDGTAVSVTRGGAVEENFEITDQTGAILDSSTDYTVTEDPTGTYAIDASVGGLTSGTYKVVASTDFLYKSVVDGTLSA